MFLGISILYILNSRLLRRVESKFRRACVRENPSSQAEIGVSHRVPTKEPVFKDDPEVNETLLRVKPNFSSPDNKFAIVSGACNLSTISHLFHRCLYGRCRPEDVSMIPPSILSCFATTSSMLAPIEYHKKEPVIVVDIGSSYYARSAVLSKTQRPSIVPISRWKRMPQGWF